MAFDLWLLSFQGCSFKISSSSLFQVLKFKLFMVLFWFDSVCWMLPDAFVPEGCCWTEPQVVTQAHLFLVSSCDPIALLQVELDECLTCIAPRVACALEWMRGMMLGVDLFFQLMED